MYMIYVQPTEEGLPPRALLVPFQQAGPFTAVGDPIAAIYEDDEWKINGESVDDEVGAAITEHAESLGVVL